MAQYKIVRKQRILGGKPIINGTRISVDLIMSYINNGMNIDDIKKAYPFLHDDQIIAAIDYTDQNIHRAKIKHEPTAA